MVKYTPRLVELCSGSGLLSAIARSKGWCTITVDTNEKVKPDLVCDIRNMDALWDTVDLLWASPPCTEYSKESMPWSRTGKVPDQSIWNAVVRLVEQCSPRWWIIENVRGAQKYHGRAVAKYGPFYLWGNFPLFECVVTKNKTALSGRSNGARAVIDPALAIAVLDACF